MKIAVLGVWHVHAEGYTKEALALGAEIVGFFEREDGLAEKAELRVERMQEKQKEKEDPCAVGEKPQTLDAWGLILEEFAELKPSLRPFLKGSSAELSRDGTLTVRLTVKLFLGMLSGDEASKTMLLNLVKAKGVEARSLRFVSVAKQEDINQIEF